MNKYQKAIEVVDTLLHLMCGEEREDGYKPTMEEMSNSMDLLTDLANKAEAFNELKYSNHRFTLEEYIEALNRMEESYYDSDNSMGEMKRFKEDINLLTGLVNEHFEENVETNFEHYKDEILECCIDHLAVVKGIPKPCSKTDCNDCDFLTIQKDCHEIAKDWLKHPYKKLTYKLNKFEFDLIQTYSDCHESCKFSEFKQLIELKNKGYFKDIALDLKIHEVLDNYEVTK